MMHDQPFVDVVTSFEHSFMAWQQWNLIDAPIRCDVIATFVADLPLNLQSKGHYQLTQSRRVVEHVYPLTGPTGETNELYVVGRGVSILVIDSSEEKATFAAIAILVSMLVAGNGVIICCDDVELAQILIRQTKETELPNHVVQCAPLSNYKEFLEKEIKNFAYIGNKQTELDVNRLLALRSGVITAIVSETDLDELPQSQDPKLVLRFITERTRTINITAVGGNATLLELGSETG